MNRRKNFEDLKIEFNNFSTKYGVDHLAEHQQKAVIWLIQHFSKGTKGLVYADEQGLGKTRVVATFIGFLLERKLIFKVLMVLPSLLHKQWDDEFKHFKSPVRTFSKLKSDTANLTYVHQNGGILFVIKNKADWYRNYFNKSGRLEESGPGWDFLVVDDGHVMSNNEAGLMLNSIKSQSRILITGQPFTNKIEDLRRLFNFVDPTKFPSCDEFKKKYGSIVLDVNHRRFNKDKVDGALKELREIYTEDNMLRQTKEDAGASLHNINVFVVLLELSKDQDEVYQTLLKLFKSAETQQVQNGEPTHLQMRKYNHMEKIRALSKVCDSASFLGTAEIYNNFRTGYNDPLLDHLNACRGSEDHSPKLDFIVSLLAKYDGEKFVIFSSNKDMLDEIEKKICREITTGKITSETNDKDRENFIKNFRTTWNNVLLISSSIGDCGVQYPADRVIIVDPLWANARLDEQCISRCHYIGAKKELTVYKLISADTVEEKIILDNMKTREAFVTMKDLRELKPKKPRSRGTTKAKEESVLNTDFSTLEELKVKFKDRTKKLGVGATKWQVRDLRKEKRVVGIVVPDIFFFRGQIHDREISTRISEPIRLLNRLAQKYKVLIPSMDQEAKDVLFQRIARRLRAYMKVWYEFDKDSPSREEHVVDIPSCYVAPVKVILEKNHKEYESGSLEANVIQASIRFLNKQDS